MKKLEKLEITVDLDDPDVRYRSELTEIKRRLEKSFATLRKAQSRVNRVTREDSREQAIEAMRIAEAAYRKDADERDRVVEILQARRAQRGGMSHRNHDGPIVNPAKMRQPIPKVDKTQDPNYLPPELAAQLLERDAELRKQPLPDATRELLILLAEECAEVVQRCTKILRFGLTVNPWTGVHNREALEREAGDVAAIFELLTLADVINDTRIDEYAHAKLDSLRKNDGRLRYAKVPEDL